jgi:hypothetical protein
MTPLARRAIVGGIRKWNINRSRVLATKLKQYNEDRKVFSICPDLVAVVIAIAEDR